jgi:hypothetical protein
MPLGDTKEMLIDELRELVGIRMAVVLAPALRALDDKGLGHLRAYLERFIGPLEDDLRQVLAHYEIRRNDESTSRKHV